MGNIKELITLSKEHLLIRPFKIEDVGDMYNNWSYEMGYEFLPSDSPHANFEITYEKIKKIVDSYSDDEIFIWAIEYEKKVIGSIEFVNISKEDDSCVVKYYLCSKNKNEKIIKDAIELIEKYLINMLDIKNIKYIDLVNE